MDQGDLFEEAMKRPSNSYQKEISGELMIG